MIILGRGAPPSRECLPDAGTECSEQYVPRVIKFGTRGAKSVPWRKGTHAVVTSRVRGCRVNATASFRPAPPYGGKSCNWRHIALQVNRFLFRTSLERENN